MTKRKAQPVAAASAVLPPENFKREDRLTAWFITIAMIALFIGGSLGPLQKLEHVGINPTRTGVIDILRLMGDLERFLNGDVFH